MLGFVKRSCGMLKRVSCIKAVYIAFVRSILEYCLIVWSPYYVTHSVRLEKVQNKPLRFLAYKLGVNVDSIDYSLIRVMVNIKPLNLRRQAAEQIFLFKLLNGEVHASELLHSLNFLAPIKRTSSKKLFYINMHRTNYAMFTPIDKICSDANGLNINMFSVPFSKFRRELEHKLYG
ncbi:hypothetical protein PPYR_00771 [Photinus pyralis]|uniref:Uncharacterized protein n=1 Tax=Photinus pyralis TaxID=7054 RepID=A0A5N4B2G5_PHOPY|nr:hypothetical protein PPYR_00771 [Photinus pyralis]